VSSNFGFAYAEVNELFSDALSDLEMDDLMAWDEKRFRFPKRGSSD
jgi:hypothetical protein